MDCGTDDAPTHAAPPALDGSSDDEPLIRLKKASAAEKPGKRDDKSTRSNGTNNKEADLNPGDSSDDEPLIKIAKVAPKPSRKTSSASPKKAAAAAAAAKKKEAPADGESLDDEPLAEITRKVYSKRHRKPALSRIYSPAMKSKRSAARKTVRYAESSSHSSDDEPLAALQSKLTKKEAEPKENSKRAKAKPKDKSAKDGNSSGDEDEDGGGDEDEVPLAKLVSRKKPVKKNTKTKIRASRNRRAASDESSEDEPLINLVKKKKKSPGKRRYTKAKKRGKAQRKTSLSDVDLSIIAAKHPQVTKLIRIIIKRCDGDETPSLNRSTKDALPAGKTNESDGSVESPQEEEEEEETKL